MLSSALEVTVYSRREAERDGSLSLTLLLKRSDQSKNGTSVSCGSFAKACGGRSLEIQSLPFPAQNVQSYSITHCDINILFEICAKLNAQEARKELKDSNTEKA